MIRLFPIKLVRLLLAISVSFWMTGAACMWSCNNNASAASARIDSQTSSAIAGHSCHSNAHHCCAKKSSKSITPANQLSDVSALGVAREAMMGDCPLAVFASAVVTKTKANAPDGNHVSVGDMPRLAKTVEPNLFRSTPLQSCNRGPTYLRCCVFLI